MIIIDASVINKLFLPNEPGHPQATSLLNQHIQKAEEVLVPDLLFYEVANTLATKTAIPVTFVAKALRKLDAYSFKILYPASQQFVQAAKFSKKYKVSVYDAMYAVLAKEKKCLLVTADEKFVEMVKLPFIKTLKDC